MILFNPNYFPKALPPNTIILQGRISAYEFWGYTNIKSITLLYLLENTLLILASPSH